MRPRLFCMKIWLTIAGFCYTGAMYAQALFSFEGLTRSDTALVYRGLDNPIRIVDYQKGQTYKVVCKTGKVSEVHENGYFFYYGMDRNHTSDTLLLFVGNRYKGSVALTSAKVPDREVRLSGAKPGKMSKSLLLAAPYLVALMPDFYYKYYVRVVKYELSLHYGGSVLSFEVKGNYIPPEVLERISTYKGKFVLDFENVWHLGSGDCFSHISSFSYEIF